MSAKRNIALSGAIAAIVAVAFVIAAIYVLPGTGLLQGSQTQGPSGTLSVMLTDPPTVPQGTTDLYMTYNKVGVHVAEAGNNSGWKVFSQSGTIDLMQTINGSQSIASEPSRGRKVQRLRIRREFRSSHLQWQELHSRSCIRKEHAVCPDSRGNQHCRCFYTSGVDRHDTKGITSRNAAESYVRIPSIGSSIRGSVERNSSSGTFHRRKARS